MTPGANERRSSAHRVRATPSENCVSTLSFEKGSNPGSVTNVDRTPKNTNLLIWHRALWMIDHGATLIFHHNWSDDFLKRSRNAFAPIKHHVLLPWATEIRNVDDHLSAVLTRDVIEGVLDLIPNDNGSVGSGILADWMAHGNTADMPLGIYDAVPSTKYNSSSFQDALVARTGDEVLFPVYQPPILLGGSNAQFDIIGWVAFHIDSQTTHGSSGSLTGHFTHFLAQGLEASDWNGHDFGVRVVQLVE